MRATRPERIQLRLGLRGRILCAQQFVDVCGRFVGRKFKEPRPDRKNRILNDTDHQPQSEDSLKSTEVLLKPPKENSKSEDSSLRPL